MIRNGKIYLTCPLCEWEYNEASDRFVETRFCYHLHGLDADLRQFAHPFTATRTSATSAARDAL